MGSQTENAAADGPIRDAGEARLRGIPPKRRGLALMATSLLLVALGTIGVLYDGNLVWINRHEHPFILGCIAAVMFGAGLVQYIPWRWLRVLTGLTSGLVALAWLMVGGLLFLWGAVSWPVASADAPGDHDYQAVVYEQPDVIDTLWTVSIQQTRGLLSRQWLAGCISNDATADSAIENVVWQSPNHLLVTTANAGIDIYVDPRTGKPEPRARWMARAGCRSSASGHPVKRQLPPRVAWT